MLSLRSLSDFGDNLHKLLNPALLNVLVKVAVRLKGCLLYTSQAGAGVFHLLQLLAGDLFQK